MKNVAAIAPTMLQAADLASFSTCLDFMTSDYNITWSDSLENYQGMSVNDYSLYWKNKIASLTSTHDVFIGFSLGGLLLLDNLNSFLNQNKIIILVSTPCILDEALTTKLNNIISACQSGKTIDAINLLNSYALSQQPEDPLQYDRDALSLIGARLEFGLGYVLHHRLSQNITHSQVPFYQLIGENSKLVTLNHVLHTPKSNIQAVPKAGHRVFEDNPVFTQQLIKQWLGLYEKQH